MSRWKTVFKRYPAFAKSAVAETCRCHDDVGSVGRRQFEDSDTNRAGSMNTRLVPVCGRDLAASFHGKLGDAAHARDLALPQIPVQVPDFLFEFVQGFTLG